MRRRLLVSYIALTAIVLLLLELPLGLLYARRERNALTSVARPDADDDGPETSVTAPVPGPSGVIGVVVVAVPTRPTETSIHRAGLALGGFALTLIGLRHYSGFGWPKACLGP